MFAYMLSTYQEDGAYDVKITLDIAKLPEMLDTYLIGEYWGEEEFRKISQEALSTLLDEHLKNKDAELTDGENLMSGWGGIQLHIIKLY